MGGHCQFNKRTNYTYDIFCYVFYISNYIRFYNFIYGYMGLFDIYSKEGRRIIMAEEKKKMKKAEELKEVLDEFMDKRKDLKEFEKELKKNKDMLTPGQVGDA